MSCCGKARAAASGTPSVSGRTSLPGPTNRSTRFEYTGETSMMVIGPITGLRYHFNGPGAQARVDARDRSHLLGIAKLREV
jgi:hypothetical protein